MAYILSGIKLLQRQMVKFVDSKKRQFWKESHTIHSKEFHTQNHRSMIWDLRWYVYFCIESIIVVFFCFVIYDSRSNGCYLDKFFCSWCYFFLCLYLIRVHSSLFLRSLTIFNIFFVKLKATRTSEIVDWCVRCIWVWSSLFPAWNCTSIAISPKRRLFNTQHLRSR